MYKLNKIKSEWEKEKKQLPATYTKKNMKKCSILRCRKIGDVPINCLSGNYVFKRKNANFVCDMHFKNDILIHDNVINDQCLKYFKKQAKYYYTKQDWSKSINNAKKYVDFCKCHKKKIDMLLLIGDCFMFIGDSKKSVTAYINAVQIASTYENKSYINYRVYRNMGLTFYNWGFLDQSKSALEKALEINHLCLYANNKMAEICVSRGELGKALVYYKKEITAWKNLKHDFSFMDNLNYMVKTLSSQKKRWCHLIKQNKDNNVIS